MTEGIWAPTRTVPTTIAKARSTSSRPRARRACSPAPVTIRSFAAVEVDPGVLNSWPKWSSMVQEPTRPPARSTTSCSSPRRAYPTSSTGRRPHGVHALIENKSSQLYMGVIEHDPATGTTTSYAAIYLWNQNYLSIGSGAPTSRSKTANLTPAWGRLSPFRGAARRGREVIYAERLNESAPAPRCRRLFLFWAPEREANDGPRRRIGRRCPRL